MLSLSAAVPAATEGDESDDSWFVRTWQTNDGLLNNDVTSVHQAPDHSLLIGTLSGMVRFDGWVMKEIRVDLPGKHRRGVLGVITAKDGSYWAICRGSLMNWLPGSPPVVYPLPGLTIPSRVTGFFQDKEGAIWLCFDKSGLFCVRNGQCTQPTYGEAGSEVKPKAITLDGQGVVWSLLDNALARWTGDRFEKVAEVDPKMTTLAAGKEGRIWLAGETQVWEFSIGRGLHQVTAFQPSGSVGYISVLREDSKEQLWIGTLGDGLLVWTNGYIEKAHLPNPDVWSLAEDHEGNIWVGTGGGGVCLVRHRVVEMFNLAHGPVHQKVRSITVDSAGNLWVSTKMNELFIRRGKDWKKMENRVDWPASQALCLTAAGKDVWIVAADEGLVRWDGQTFTRVPIPFLEKNGTTLARAILVDRTGKIWIAQGNQLIYGQPGQWQKLKVPAARALLVTLCEDAEGQIWAGDEHGLLLRVEGGQLVDRTPSILTDNGGIRTLLADSEGSLWIGTGGDGLARLRGNQCNVVTTAEGLSHNVISQLARDSYGRLWANGDLGLFYMTLSEVNTVMDGLKETFVSVGYGKDENLPSLQANYGYSPNLVRDESTHLWFATRSGLAIVHTEYVAESKLAPGVQISAVHVNDTPLGVDASRATAQAGVRSLMFEVEVFSFASPEKVALQYRLEGIDEDWNKLRQGRQVIYGAIPAGEYQFRVRAASKDQVWSEQDAVLTLTVLPFFWETLWFKVVSVLAALSAGLLIDHYISNWWLKRRTGRLRRRELLQKERARIAQDMHDQLGASLTQISLLADLADGDGIKNSPIPALAQTARQAVSELDEIVWAINPRHDRLGSLIEYAGQQTVNILSAAGVRCRLDLPEEAPAMSVPTDFRHNLLLIIREAVNNASKHAQATEVILKMTFDDDGLSAHIIDDGQGFDEPPQKGDGLVNMQERAYSIGGECTISSQKGIGTRVDLRVPWPEKTEFDLHKLHK